MNSNSELLLRNARAVLPGGVAEGASVLIERDRITRINRTPEVEARDGGDGTRSNRVDVVSWIH